MERSPRQATPLRDGKKKDRLVLNEMPSFSPTLHSMRAARADGKLDGMAVMPDEVAEILRKFQEAGQFHLAWNGQAVESFNPFHELMVLYSED
ncbi:hypothetical protein CEXT_390791 [Caerostris extrusa]|uniref:Uncharacterized protein n=1 Tax=Caerostris extrusa TaxID=172846 RepID=A0AAV4W6D1_CAEEX|nr:hypothetical protein CEXT_390791 [Caerostris extrusa]